MGRDGALAHHEFGGHLGIAEARARSRSTSCSQRVSSPARSRSASVPGYHYNGLQHALELLSEGFTPEEAAHLCADQSWAARPAFLVVLAARLERMSVKYPTPRAYRVCLLDAGHLGQTFALTATALGLGPAQTGAFRDSAIAGRCGLDNTGHTPSVRPGRRRPRSETAGRSPAGRSSRLRLHHAARPVTWTGSPRRAPSAQSRSRNGSSRPGTAAAAKVRPSEASVSYAV
ncbi:SagB/ThcOx family dehydrogenase [Streptomyces sp. NBC_01102]|nr:SagB/ThcOx family dehydrogenase [Streptomyces sp. NBC_01102]